MLSQNNKRKCQEWEQDSARKKLCDLLHTSWTANDERRWKFVDGEYVVDGFGNAQSGEFHHLLYLPAFLLGHHVDVEVLGLLLVEILAISVI